MAKTKQQKKDTIEVLATGFKNSKSVVFANFQGLSVSDMENLRNKCRENNIDVLVAKKTLVKLALKEAGLEVDPTNFEGGVATFIGKEDEVAAAKQVNMFAKEHDMVKMFGGILEGKFVDEQMVKSLANLPTKEELLARVVGSINAPVSGFVNVLAGNLRNLVYVLSAVKEAKEA